MHGTTGHPLDGDDRWAISIPEAGRRLNISRAHAYRLAASGQLPAVRLGGRKVVPLVALGAILSPSVDEQVGRGDDGAVDTGGASASGRLGRSSEDETDRGDEPC